MTFFDAPRWRQALEAGEAAAKAERVGKPFVSAFPAAEAAGYIADTAEFWLFMRAYWDALPTPVVTDMAGIITKISK